MRGRLFVLSAPSGAGKTSLVQSLVDDDEFLAVSISHTTRPRRDAEIDGVHYHFVTVEGFAAMRAAGEFLECATVFDHSYGTSRRAVAAGLAHGDLILEIDWQGAAQVRQRWQDAVSIFVLPPSRQALAARLARRGQDPPEVIAKRTAQAVADMTHYEEFDYLVVNDDFDATVATLKGIVAATRQGRTVAKEDYSALLAELLSAN